MANLHDSSVLIFNVALPIPCYQLFDYLAPEGVQASLGARVEVPFGSHKKIGYLISVSQRSSLALTKLKPIVRVLDENALLSEQDLALLRWVSRYYHHPIGEVVSLAFPVLLRKQKNVLESVEIYYDLTELGRMLSQQTLLRAPKQCALIEMFQANAQPLSASLLSQWDKQWRVTLKSLLAKQFVHIVPAPLPEQLTRKKVDNVEVVCSSAQQVAIDSVCKGLGSFGVFLLEGVTGSGKTEVYMQIIHTVLQRGQQVLVLVPEITLTPQLESRFRQRFTVGIAVSHSKLSDKQRCQAWLQIQQGHCAILLGTRSALFTPFKQLGLIILDEEHDASFKQQEGCRFSARDVAVVRGKLLNLPVLLGSATPSLESLLNATTHRYQWLTLPERAGQAVAPELQLLDIRNKKMQDGLSELLITVIAQALENKEQILLFLNRRGFAPTLICHGCGWVARCLHCDANLVIHHHERCLRCHHCGQEQALLSQCPCCHSTELTALGLGTERVENRLRHLFADKTIVRLDRDSTQRKGTLEDCLAKINQGQVDIILGTQMLAKGHHFPQVTLVAILDVDSGLFSIDFHASERLAQLVVQVAGRAGREQKLGKVILQTRSPDHPLLNTLIYQGYHQFAKNALAERQQAHLPPYTYQAMLRAYAPDEMLVQRFLQSVCELAQAINYQDTQILGPVSAPMVRRAAVYHYQVLLQQSKRSVLQDLLTHLIPKIAQLKSNKMLRWSVDVDPVDLY